MSEVGTRLYTSPVSKDKQVFKQANIQAKSEEAQNVS